MKLKVKKLHPEAILPMYATDGAAAFDLATYESGHFYQALTFPTGLAFEVPEGHVMLIFSRSGHGFRDAMRLANCVGVIDSDYRGEVKVRLTSDDDLIKTIPAGARIAQAIILPIPRVTFDLVEELPATERGEGGFGSTG